MLIQNKEFIRRGARYQLGVMLPSEAYSKKPQVDVVRVTVAFATLRDDLESVLFLINFCIVGKPKTRNFGADSWAETWY